MAPKLHNRNMKKSKKATVSEREDGVDMISKLPDEILQLIISRLQGTEEVVRTSILSKRWRFMWILVPSIDIDFTRRLDRNEENFKRDILEEFVYRVLLNNSLDLDSFRLYCASYFSMSTVGQWIEAAIRRNVKKLDLIFSPRAQYEDVKVPNCLVTSGSLEVLRLSSFGHYLSVPNCQGFSLLRVLELNNLKFFDGGLLTEFLKFCPLLEDLKLKNLEFSRKLDSLDKNCDRNIQIFCPNLLFLELTGYIGHFKFILKNLNSLKKAVINLSGSLSDLMGNSNTIRELFVGLSHVESLSLDTFIILKYTDAASLPKLKTLELTVGINEFFINELIQILRYYPHLEALHLIVLYVFSYPTENSFYFSHQMLDAVESRGILTRHLKRVEFPNFSGENGRLAMARSLLLYGNTLEEMVFSWVNKDKLPQKSMEIMKKIYDFRKASSTVKLIMK